jgi:predicted SAM-dependent methyltransferase
MAIKGETDHCRDRLIKYCQGQGVDLGCGNSKIKIDTIGIDLYHPEADMHADVRDLSFYPDNYFDYVYSSHMLEELQNTEATLKGWLRILKPAGYLVLYQADKELYYPIGHPLCNTSHQHHFSGEELWGILERIGGVELVHHDRHPELKEWSFELVVKKL